MLLSQSRSVVIPSMDIILEADAGIDLAVSGKWFIQFAQDDWVKHDTALYPVKTDRTRTVSDAQNAVKDAFDDYIVEALKGGFYSQGISGRGVTLSARTAFSYIAVDFKDGEYCRAYVRHEGQQYTINIYPDLSDENAAATTARANIVAQLNIISTAAKAGRFHE